MAFDVVIPRLGWSMEEGVFAGWIKKPGDAVRPGEPLFMLEGEKATQEIEAVDGGVLHVAPDAPAEGQNVLVGRVIGRLCATDEAPNWTVAAPPAGQPAVPPSPPPAPAAVPGRLSPGSGPSAARGPIPAAASPSVRRLARRMGIDLATVVPRLPGGRLSAEDLAMPAGPPRTSPRARRVARERGIDIAVVRGSGAGGRVRERDVLAAEATGVADHGPAAVLPSGATAVPVTQVRRTIARQMVRSREETVPVTLTAWADATALLAARAACKAAGGAEAATLNDMILKALADAIRGQPVVAARWGETHLVLPGDQIDIGLAVDAPGGLVVPVVCDVAASSLAQVAGQTRRLIERARTGRLTAAEMHGGVFTLTSLGPYGIEFFTPVINHPEAAILGVGAIRAQPTPAPGGTEGFVFQRQLPLSLTFDHRIIDGGPAAKFLGDVAARIAAFGSARDA